MGNCLANSSACTSEKGKPSKPSREEEKNSKMDGQTVRSVKLVVTKKEAARLLSLISNGGGADEISVLETVLLRGFQLAGCGRGGREGYWRPSLESIPEV